MNANLTIDTLSFNQVYSDKSESLRRESSRGANLPTTLKIAHQDYVDSATKLPGKRSLVRFDRHVALTDSTIVAPVSAYVVVTRPNDAAIESEDILAVVQHLISLLQEDDSGLDLMDDIFVNLEQ